MTRLTLLHLNDLHAYLEPHPELFWQDGQPLIRPAGGLARIKAYFDDVRANVGEAVVALDGGDTFHGTGPVVQTRGEFMPDLLNPLGLDGMTAHWDFGYGPGRLRELADRLRYPLLACNVYGPEGDRPFPAAQLLDRGGLRVGILGVASNLVEEMSHSWGTQALHVTDGREEVRRLVPDLRAAGADVVVVLSHLGFPQDCDLAGEVPGIDVILSGHTHNRLEVPARVGRTLLTQGGCHGSFVTQLDLNVTPGSVELLGHELKVMTSDLREDPVLAGQVEEQLRPFRTAGEAIIGETRALLHRGTTLSAPADRLLTDAVRQVADAEIGLSNGWRYGAPIPAGPVTRLAAWNLIPHNPPVGTAELAGAELWQLLEGSLEAVFSRDPWQQRGGYVKRMSGVTLAVKVENPPGQRLQWVEVSGERLDPGRVYRVAYLTRQAVPSHTGRNHRELPLRALDALERFLRHHGPYTPPPPNVLLT